MSSETIEKLCYATMGVLTVISSFTDQVPIQINITVFSLAIIIAASNRSLYEFIHQFKKINVRKEGEKQEQHNIETMSKEEAMQFPIFAGATLVGLYVLIKFFGKEIINPLLLTYMGIGGATGIKALIQAIFGNTFDKLD